MVKDGQHHALALLPTWKRRGTHFPGSWVGSRPEVDEGKKSRTHRISIPGPSNP